MSHSFSIYRDAISPFFLPPPTSCLSLFSSLPHLPSAHNSFLLTSDNINTAYYTGFKWKASKVEMSVFISGISLAGLEDWFLFSQFSHSVVSESVLPHGLQHTRLPRPSPTPGAYSNSLPSSWWCHLTISSSVVPFPFHLQSFSASGSFSWVSSSHQVAKVLEFQLQHQSFQWIFKTDFLCNIA